MQSIFGTDGIRGRFNEEITYSLAYKVGYALGSTLEKKNPILIGRDTRISGDILLQAITQGINESGKKFINLGICPTPAIPCLIKEGNLSSGIMISASHNPPEYNGIKIFDHNGQKITKNFETKIQKIIEELKQNISIPKFPKINETSHTKKLKPIIEKEFKNHPGSTNNFWFATEYEDVVKLLNFFIKEKSNLFGDYEDAVDQKDNILFHSALSPYINLGLITPEFVVQKVLDFHKKNKIRMNSLEGYIRQVIGWREFMRGIYQSYSQEMETGNFFKQNRKMKNSWYDGTTGLPPLDYAIKNAVNHGWSHHIERLMILSNIMNLCEIKPTIVYKWFMEMFVDSSDWVMVPNVYGMGLFSDGGIFATKPYICGSSYFMKMMDFKKGDWCNTMDGLYWRFINRNRSFFLKNPRLSMMVRIFDKMKSDRKKLILSEAEKFINKNTYGN